MYDDLDRTSIHTIRTLAMDAVQKAGSGHPGTPMALAPVAYGLWRDHLRYDPAHPAWPDRDRFVLSCGHASMLLYATLHLAGVVAADARGRPLGRPAVPLEEIRRFRQLDSLTPGHPEHGHTTGVETTTGPLGQGVANSVGMAIARGWLAARFDRPGFELFRHRVFALCSDGDMMEGISSEAASLAGHLKLAHLCWIYDDNRITIDGPTALAFSEDVGRRFEAYGWSVLKVADPEDPAALHGALAAFERGTGRPTLIVVRSHIGFGAPHRQDTAKAHGEPLGEDEVRLAKRAYGWPEDAHFLVPDGIRERFQETVGARGAELSAAWRATLERYRAAHPEPARELEGLLAGELPKGWADALPAFPADDKGMATRASSSKALGAVAARIPWLVGGSADLAPSNKTLLAGEAALSATEPGGRNVHFGVREHAMASISNGMALSGLRPYAGTFLIFSDYMRPAQRLAAMMKLPVIYVFTHDSIGVGEDGPTHQPVEQLAALRAIPGLRVIRPADANEACEAWKAALGARDEPTALVLTRQDLPTFDRARLAAADLLHKGAYVLADAPHGQPQVILIGTGSEVALCLAARERLADEGVAARVVSMPCWELFERQDEAWRDAVLPPDVIARVAVEQAVGFGWARWVGERGALVCMHGFGASAPYQDLQQRFGFTVENVVRAAKEQLSPAAAR
jgi:transketolase